jgi:hypothetical protein
MVIEFFISYLQCYSTLSQSLPVDPRNGRNLGYILQDNRLPEHFTILESSYLHTGLLAIQ